MSGSRRNQVVTDQPVQGELLFRALVYWLLCMLVLELLVAAGLLLNGPDRTLVEIIRESVAVSAPAILGSVFLLPFVLYDLLRVSNRFVGPINSVRFALRQLAEGKPARRVYLRRDDFWQELAHYTNVLAEKIESSQLEDEGDETEEDPYDEDEDIPCTDELDREPTLELDPEDEQVPEVLAFANER